MNSLALSRISIIISAQILEKEDSAITIEFLNKIISKISGVNAKESTVLLLTEVGLITLNSVKDITGSREIIEKAEALLNELDGVSSAHAPFYKLSSSYFAAISDYSSFYRESLKYLGCLNAEQMDAISQPEKENWAIKLCVSALLGRNIYNYGELLMHDMVNYISDENKYLLELVRGFNEGSLSKVDKLQQQLISQPDLEKDLPFLRKKITLMCLVETIFQRPVNQRTISFKDISDITRVSLDLVELLVMKAMSKKLIKGRIDQENEFVMVKWVQPRVLNMSQIEVIQKNIKTWTSSVGDMGDLINLNAGEILN